MGAIKVKDGLFIGDEFAAQDLGNNNLSNILEFVVANKVTRVINTAGSQIPNHWEPIGVSYMTFAWEDNESQILFSETNSSLPANIFKFIEEALEKSESVLVHSVWGQSRSSVVVSVYLMFKYNWHLSKVLEFLNSRRPDNIFKQQDHNNFYQQLKVL